MSTNSASSRRAFFASLLGVAASAAVVAKALPAAFEPQPEVSGEMEDVQCKCPQCQWARGHLNLADPETGISIRYRTRWDDEQHILFTRMDVRAYFFDANGMHFYSDEIVPVETFEGPPPALAFHREAFMPARVELFTREEYARMYPNAAILPRPAFHRDAFTFTTPDSDAERIANYFERQRAEILALAPATPWIGKLTAGKAEEERKAWKSVFA